MTRRQYEVRMAQQREQEYQVKALQKYVGLDQINRAVGQSDRRVEFIRRNKQWEAEEQERNLIAQMETVRIFFFSPFDG